MTLETLSRHRAFGGAVGFYRHAAATTACAMRFSVFAPPQAERGPVPVLYYLAGLTCTEETFMIKAGAQRLAAELGLMLVAPDTSPRGVPLPGDSESWDFGVGAGFYLDATQEPWSKHYRMYSYVTEELPAVIAANFPADAKRQGIFGHSMGGHGALTIGLRLHDRYRSISAFAPIVAPMDVPWGQKAFTNYLGGDRSAWKQFDATTLMLEQEDGAKRPRILIDQGLADQFLASQLQPERFEEACAQVGQPLTLRRHEGYDHGYYFISTFIEDHLRHHAAILQKIQ
ncbi:MAG TPA: S-formylglutathione hydrolase [Steroidobacteraceae bacterium]|nr:S-formylglutathione hydrolase [Steroidobacteraceae bacterium]